ncbi:MAG TPA: C1 family peptidase [Edaphocola sp.]|nr:C1 family peptidase [Edaphocola sp.]
MRRLILPLALLLAGFLQAHGQKSPVYQFSKIYETPASAVISQGNTGTCWSFSTTSFLESEIYRETGHWVDLSEMYNVRMLYPVKMLNFIGRQGHAQFGPGGLSHDVIFAFEHFGAVPESIYSGLFPKETRFDFTVMAHALTMLADSAVANQSLRMNIRKETEDTLDKYMGTPPQHFEWEGKEYTPESFAASLPLNPDDYIEFTSFGFQPYYSRFILNIPDNYNNGAYWNVPLDSLTAIIDGALAKGYSVVVDCDVSEKTFLRKDLQIAVFPADTGAGFRENIVPEQWIRPQQRDLDFWAYRTEDDHLMHIVGLYKDQLGHQYYKVKNSWGADYLRKGFWMMSKAYTRAKAIGIMVNKKAVSGNLAAQTFQK